jgi:hypothetical protein
VQQLASAQPNFEAELATKAGALAAARREQIRLEAAERLAQLAEQQSLSQAAFYEALQQQQLLQAGDSAMQLRQLLQGIDTSGGALKAMICYAPTPWQLLHMRR